MPSSLLSVFRFILQGNWHWKHTIFVLFSLNAVTSTKEVAVLVFLRAVCVFETD